MKKVTIFLMFVLMLAQVVSVAHAVTDSLSTASQSIELLSPADTADKTSSSETEDCLKGCHGHAHFYINAQIIKQQLDQKEALLNSKQSLFKAFIFGPESPPPSFS